MTDSKQGKKMLRCLLIPFTCRRINANIRNIKYSYTKHMQTHTHTPKKPSDWIGGGGGGKIGGKLAYFYYLVCMSGFLTEKREYEFNQNKRHKKSKQKNEKRNLYETVVQLSQCLLTNMGKV